MKITLTQPEIEQAVREFVGKGVSLNTNTPMTVEFSMGRGENGLTAAIDVPYMGVASLPVSPTVAATVTLPTNLPVTPAATPVPRAALPVTPVTAPVDAPVATADEPVTEAAEPIADSEAAAAPATGRSLFSSAAQ